MRRALGILVAAAVFGLLALVPKISLDTHGVFVRAEQPRTLQLLGLMLVFGAVALAYDLLFGFTGLLSFGHALYFAVGVYLTAIGTTKWDWSLPKTLAFTALVAFVLPLVLGTVSLRVAGRLRDGDARLRGGGVDPRRQEPARLDRRRGGVLVAFQKLPEAFVGVLNTKNLYWLARRVSLRRIRDRELGCRLLARPCLAGDP